MATFNSFDKPDLRIKQTCENSGYVFISQPSILKIPKGCEITGDKFKFINEENVMMGDHFKNKNDE